MNGPTGIQVTVEPRPDARWAKVKIVCKHHPDGDMLAEWSTLDGKQVMVAFNASSGEEFVGYQPSETEKERILNGPLRTLLSWGVAAPDDGDESHFRYRLRCRVAGCRLDVQLRSHNVEKLHDLTREVWRQEMAEIVVQDIDAWV